MRKGAVKRPSIPPVFAAALAFWLFCAIAYGLHAYYEHAGTGVLMAVICLPLLPAIYCARKHCAYPLVVLLGISCGFGCGLAHAVSLSDAQEALSQAGEASMVVRIESDISQGSYDDNAIAKVESCEGIGGLSGRRVYLRGELKDKMRYGDVVLISASLQQPGTYLEGTCWTKGLSGVAKVNSISVLGGMDPMRMISRYRNGFIDFLEDGFAGDEGTKVLEAIVCGYRESLDESDLYADYRSSGAAHLIAVSGAHLSLLCAMVMSILRILSAPKRASYALQVALILAFLVFSGMPVSSLRAALMVVCSISAFWSGRRASSLNALGICILAILVMNPECSVSVSFLLSAVSTISIVLFSRLIAQGKSESKMLGFLRESAAISLSASIATIPLSVAVFSEVSLVSLLSNLAIGPVFSASCGFGFAAAATYCVPGLGWALTQLAGMCIYIMNAVMKACAALPFACIPAYLELWQGLVVSASVGLALYVLWPRFRASAYVAIYVAAIAALLSVNAISAMLPADSIIMLDVGQGDCFALRSGGRTLIVDTGNQVSSLKESLARAGIIRADALLVTHADSDHCDCLEDIVRYVGISEVFVSSSVEKGESQDCVELRRRIISLGLDPQGLSAGNEISFGNFRIRVLSPQGSSGDGGNNDSIVFYLDADIDSDEAVDYRALFCGDAEASILESLPQLESVDVFKVSHHGSKTGVSSSLQARLRPTVSLISVGAGNRYGHPSQEALSWLESASEAVYRSDIDGIVSIRLSKAGMEVRTLG